MVIKLFGKTIDVDVIKDWLRRLRHSQEYALFVRILEKLILGAGTLFLGLVQAIAWASTDHEPTKEDEDEANCFSDYSDNDDLYFR